MMENKLGYRLNVNGNLREGIKGIYHLEDIQSMTTHQLREICRNEKIIDGIVNTHDKEELVRVIMRYRGAATIKFITKENKDGRLRLEKAVAGAQLIEDNKIMGLGRLIIYKGRGVHFYDNMYMKYDERFVGTNAVVISSERKICAIFNVEAKNNDVENMYLTRKAGLFSQESEQRNYEILFMQRNISDQLYDLYEGNISAMSVNPRMYRFKLLHFQVKNPVVLPMPLVIDFGYSNTAVATYLGSRFYEAHGIDEKANTYWKPHQMNEVSFYNVLDNYKEEKAAPCCVTLRDLSEEDNPEWVFGYDAVKEVSSNYGEDGYSIVDSMKYWLYDPDADEEFIDRNGRRHVFLRRYILGLYFHYLLTAAADYFKCEIKEIYFIACTKQKKMFADFFGELLPKYDITEDKIIDESTCTLYGTIMDLLDKKKLQMRQQYKALLIDCGGSMINASSAVFSVENRRMSFNVDIKNTFWDSSMDFSGRLLTHRIMQALKIYICNAIFNKSEETAIKKYAEFWDNNGFVDVYRYIDDHGIDELYSVLEDANNKAEEYIPSNYADWEGRNVTDYYRVRNNYIALFMTAEKVKCLMYSDNRISRIKVVDHAVYSTREHVVGLDRWRLNIFNNGNFSSMGHFEDIIVEKSVVNSLLDGMVYNIIKEFVGELYDTGALDEYSVIRLTGQASYPEIFRNALSEFVAGIRIQGSTIMKRNLSDVSAKCSGLSGAIKYLYNKRYGFSDIVESYDCYKIPYDVVGYTHGKQQVVLMEGRKWRNSVRTISRSMEDLTLQLYLLDRYGKERTTFNYFCRLDDFIVKTYEELAEIYGNRIKQDDVDVIVDRETKFFVWADPDKWGITVVPVCRYKENLWLGKEQFFYFETGKWIMDNC